jgi:hypothetical protein
MRLVLLVRALDRVSAMGCKVLNEMRAAFSIGDVARGEVNAAIKQFSGVGRFCIAGSIEFTVARPTLWFSGAVIELVSANRVPVGGSWDFEWPHRVAVGPAQLPRQRRE